MVRKAVTKIKTGDIVLWVGCRLFFVILFLETDIEIYKRCAIADCACPSRIGWHKILSKVKAGMTEITPAFSIT